MLSCPRPRQANPNLNPAPDLDPDPDPNPYQAGCGESSRDAAERFIGQCGVAGVAALPMAPPCARAPADAPRLSRSKTDDAHCMARRAGSSAGPPNRSCRTALIRRCCASRAAAPRASWSCCRSCATSLNATELTRCTSAAAAVATLWLCNALERALSTSLACRRTALSSCCSSHWE